MAENPALLTLTHQHYVKDYVSDNILETNVFLNKMKSSGKIKYGIGGTKIGEGVARVRKIDVKGWAALSTSNVEQPDLHENWEHQWGGVISDYFISEWDKLANSGKSEALFDMQVEYEKAQLEDLNEYLEDSMFLDRTGLSEPQWGGLAAFVKKTGTYGGLSQASGDSIGNGWKAQIIGGGSSGKPTTIANSFKTTPTPYLTYMIAYTTRGKSKGKKNQVDYMITTRNGWLHIHAAIESIRRVVVEKSSLNVGHQNFVWSGVPVFWSDSCPANSLYGINSNYLELWCQTKQLLQTREYETNQPIGQVFQKYSKSQIVCRQPRNFAKLSTSHIG